VRYLSIFFEIKDSDRTNPVSDEVQPTRLPPQKKQEWKVRSKTFGFPHGDRVVLNGEFDSGSERTLAAWIRHASRAGFFPVAIQGKV